MREGSYKPDARSSQEIQHVTHENESHVALREFIQNQGFKEAATFDDLIEELRGMQRADFPFTTSDGMRLDINSLITLVRQAAKKEGLFAVDFPTALVTRTGGFREALHKLYEAKHSQAAVAPAPERVKTPSSINQEIIEQSIEFLGQAQNFEVLKKSIARFNENKPSTKGVAAQPVAIKDTLISVAVNGRTARVRAVLQKDLITGRLAISYNNRKLNEDFGNFFD